MNNIQSSSLGQTGPIVLAAVGAVLVVKLISTASNGGQNTPSIFSTNLSAAFNILNGLLQTAKSINVGL